MRNNFYVSLRMLCYVLSFIFLTIPFAEAQKVSAQKVLWQIGQADHSASEFALAPSGYKNFLKNDFGWEDKFYLIGFSNPKKDWPYAIPGPQDKWSGSSGTAGGRTAVENILFGINKQPDNGKFKLIIDLLDISAKNPPLLKVSVNDSSWEFQLPKGSGHNTL